MWSCSNVNAVIYFFSPSLIVVACIAIARICIALFEDTDWHYSACMRSIPYVLGGYYTNPR